MQSEQAILVDIDDNIIGYKDRYNLEKEDIVRIAAVWLEDGKGNVLIHKRSIKKKSLPGRWENAAGGGVSHLQTYEEAAYAELDEEIGVTGIELEFVSKNIVTTPNGRKMCGWHKGIIDWPIEKFVLAPNEVDEIKWVDKQELFELRDKNPEDYMPSSKYWRELFNG